MGLKCNLVPRAFPSKTFLREKPWGRGCLKWGWQACSTRQRVFKIAFFQAFFIVRVFERPPVALQLCPPLQFGPLTYQPIECVFVSSNQSALWSCLYHLTYQLTRAVAASYPDVSLLMKMCAQRNAGRTQRGFAFRLPSVPFPWSLAVHHQSLAFRARLCHAENEAPEEEAGAVGWVLFVCFADPVED